MMGGFTVGGGHVSLHPSTAHRAFIEPLSVLIRGIDQLPYKGGLNAHRANKSRLRAYEQKSGTRGHKSRGLIF